MPSQPSHTATGASRAAGASGGSRISGPAPLDEGQGLLRCPPAEPDEPDELSRFLSLVEADNEYRVDEVLKRSEYETTERVSRTCDDGTASGSYIRKYLKTDSGLGSVYATLFEEQQAHGPFAHLPAIEACYRLKDDLVVVMDYVQGETLQETVYRCDPSPQLAMEVFPRICEAVRELHERFSPPIIHRDLKPSNLILSWDKITLIDFGIARVYAPDAAGDTVRFGTRDYAPPEQFGYGQTDVRSDVYALGLLLFYCLTERAATHRDRERGFADAQVPEEFRAVIQRAAAFDPDARFACVADLQAAFDQAAAAYRERMSQPEGEGASLHPAPAHPSATKENSPALASLAPPDPRTLVLGTTPAPTGASDALLTRAARRASALIPAWVGVIWNTALVFLWVLVLFVCGMSVVDPPASDAHFPLWFRIVEYPVFMGVSATAIFYFLADRRALRRRFARLGSISLAREFAVVVIMTLGLALIMTLLSYPARGIGI